MPIQTISRKCQNILSRISRDCTGEVKPLIATCAIMVPIQIRPKVTWVPCVPTRVKKLDRKALR